MIDDVRFKRETIDNVVVLEIRGEVDIANAAELQAELEEAAENDGPGVVIDLRFADYFDSRTIAMLADFAVRMKVSRQRVALVAPADGFSGTVLRIAGIPHLIPTLESVGQAIEAVGKPSL